MRYGIRRLALALLLSALFGAAACAAETGVFYLRANGTALAVRADGGAAAGALLEALGAGDVTVSMRDYGGYEKVGPLPVSLPARDETVTARPGDVVLCQGNRLAICYGENTSAYTRLGRIEGATGESLLAVFGRRDAAVTLSLRP